MANRGNENKDKVPTACIAHVQRRLCAAFGTPNDRIKTLPCTAAQHIASHHNTCIVTPPDIISQYTAGLRIETRKPPLLPQYLPPVSSSTRYLTIPPSTYLSGIESSQKTTQPQNQAMKIYYPYSHRHTNTNNPTNNPVLLA